MNNTAAIWVIALGTIMAISGGGYIIYRIIRMRRALKELLPRERYRRTIRESEILSQDYLRWETSQGDSGSPDPAPNPIAIDKTTTTSLELVQLMKRFQYPSVDDTQDHPSRTKDKGQPVTGSASPNSREGQLVR